MKIFPVSRNVVFRDKLRREFLRKSSLGLDARIFLNLVVNSTNKGKQNRVQKDTLKYNIRIYKLLFEINTIAELIISTYDYTLCDKNISTLYKYEIF